MVLQILIKNNNTKQIIKMTKKVKLSFSQSTQIIMMIKSRFKQQFWNRARDCNSNNKRFVSSSCFIHLEKNVRYRIILCYSAFHLFYINIFRSIDFPFLLCVCVNFSLIYLISLSLVVDLTKYDTLYVGMLQPLFMWSITCCFNWNTCSFSDLMTPPNSTFSPFSIFTLSSSFEMRSSFRLRHFDAAKRFRWRFRSNLIFS